MIADLGLADRVLAAADLAPALPTADRDAMGLVQGLSVEDLARGLVIEDPDVTAPDLADQGRMQDLVTEVQTVTGRVTGGDRDVIDLETEDREVTGPVAGAAPDRGVPRQGRAGDHGVHPRARGVGLDGNDLNPDETAAMVRKAEILADRPNRAEVWPTWTGSSTGF